MSLRKELLDRLSCSKYIFLRGIDVLDRGGPYSSGLAVLHFQDAAEMFLRVIAEYLHCTLKENAPFNQIIDAIDGVDNRKLTHRSALNQLNKARLNFKHFGLEPRVEDVSKFRRDLDGFFPTALSTFLNLDFESISLTKLIGHRRTENFLNEAERLIGEEDYEGAIRSAAIAFQIYRSHSDRDEECIHLDRFRRYRNSELQDLVEKIEEALNCQQSQLNLIINGVNLADFRRFQRVTPIVHLSDAGTFHVVYSPFGEPVQADREIALFCHRFATEAILLMKQYQAPSRFPMQIPKRKFKVVYECDVIVWPCENPEVIRKAEIGETLLGRPQNFDKSDYIAVIQDGDTAYVKKEALIAIDLVLKSENDS